MLKHALDLMAADAPVERSFGSSSSVKNPTSLVSNPGRGAPPFMSQMKKCL